MTPEYLHELADLADPQKLWRLRGLDQLNLPPEQRQQLDTGVALRRHAQHLHRLSEALAAGKSLLITPLAAHSTASRMVDTPAEHAELQRTGKR